MPTDENVSRVKLRAPVIATFFSFFAVVSTATAVLAGEAVTLDFTPLGAHAASTARTSAAPADVNFGSYPLSVLGIENAIHGAGSHVDEYARGTRVCDDGPIAYTVLAIRDWEKHYPSDPWIAKDLLALAKFYARVGTHDSRADERGVAEWLVHDYPATAYATNATTMLADLGAPVPHPDRPAIAAKRDVHATTFVAKARTAGQSASPTVALKATATAESPPVARPVFEASKATESDVRTPAQPTYASVPQATYAAPRKPTVRPTLPPYAHYDSSEPASTQGGGGGSSR